MSGVVSAQAGMFEILSYLTCLLYNFIFIKYWHSKWSSMFSDIVHMLHQYGLA